MKKILSLICSSVMFTGAFGEAVASSQNDIKTYDYIAPFKDYNNKIVLTINNVASGKKVEFTSNFEPKAGWGNCFGTPAYNVNFDVKPLSKGHFVTTMTLKDPSQSFDFSQGCDIMGTNSGDAIVLSKVVVPSVDSVKVDGQSLDFDTGCPGNVCKDPTPGFVNAGYYAQWSVWGRKYNPYNFKYDKLNTLIYAFIGFDRNTGNLKTLDADADNWGLSAAARAVKKYPYLKAYLSFGGWLNNKELTTPMFMDLASSEERMQNFANQAVDLMRKLGFNGIDIDWEWWSVYDNTNATAKQMLPFYKILRATLDKASKEDGKKYYLTIAVNGGKDRIEAMEDPLNPNSVPDYWKQVGELMDEINVMNYDYKGDWAENTKSWFQASKKFPSVDFTPQEEQDTGKAFGWSIEDSINTYIKLGVPAKKLVVGIPLYGRTMQVDSDTNGGLLQKIVGKGSGEYGEKGSVNYKCIMNPVANPEVGCSDDIPGMSDLVFYNINNNTSVFNKYGKEAMQPWAYNPVTHDFISYDDTWSAAAKTQYVKNNNLGGTMFWEVDGDSTDDSKSIINAVAKAYSSSNIYVSVSNVTKSAATISWNKPQLKGGDVSYSVIVNGATVVDNLNVTNYTLSNLEADTKYTVKVVAKTSEESTSDEVTFKTAATPAPVLNVEVNKVTENSANIAWNKPKFQSDDVTYTVLLNGQSVIENIKEQNFELKNLKADTQYKVTVVASTSQESLSSDVTFKTTAAPVPAPIHVFVSDITDDTATVTWDGPTGGDVTFTVILNGQTVASNIRELSYNLSNLQENTTYTVKIVASVGSKTTEGETSFKTISGGTTTWDPNKIYVKGDQVIYEGVNYTAKWWTKGDVPSNGGPWDKEVIPGGEWDPNAVYNTGDEVIYQGDRYQAKWWTQGDNPQDGGPWKKISGTSNEWDPNTVYTGGDVVTYQGSKYKAKWWTQGDEPTKGGPWEKINS